MKMILISLILLILCFLINKFWSMLAMFFTSSLVFSTNNLDSSMMGSMVLLCSICFMICLLCCEDMFMEKLTILVCVVCMFFFISKSVFFLYFFFEASLIPIFLIIGGWGTHQQRFSAMQYILFYMLVCSIPFLFYLISFDMFMSGWVENCISLSSIFLFLGFLVKLPVFVFHSWLPLAHVESPTAGSVILASILLKLGSIGLMRIFMSIFKMSELFLLFGLSGAILSSWMCFMFSDIKKVIAMSSVAHMSLIIIFMSWMTSNSILFIIFISITHGMVSGVLFMLAGMMAHTNQSRMIVSMTKSSQSKKELMYLSVVLMSNLGLPMTVSFFPELLVMSWSMMMSPLLGSLLSVLMIFVCYYNLWLFVSLYSGSNIYKKSNEDSLLMSTLLLTPTFLIIF